MVHICKFGITLEDKFLMETYNMFCLFYILLAPTLVLGSPKLVILRCYKTGCSFLIGDGWVLSIAASCKEKKVNTNACKWEL